MNIRVLHQFLTLAEHLHFGRASIASNISISALSRNIRQLEQETGAELFHRDNRDAKWPHISTVCEGRDTPVASGLS